MSEFYSDQTIQALPAPGLYPNLEEFIFGFTCDHLVVSNDDPINTLYVVFLKGRSDFWPDIVSAGRATILKPNETRTWENRRRTGLMLAGQIGGMSYRLHAWKEL